ncbi:hypothetical protein [Halobacillus ihumii]|uniref:hypothetical protein n=1 Tax=Halobacillus ihumii TaxID=2686092 RepID=UPI0013D13CF6|nr:hypothetical protein [Halobacillus ihumii]
MSNKIWGILSIIAGVLFGIDLINLIQGDVVSQFSLGLALSYTSLVLIFGGVAKLTE